MTIHRAYGHVDRTALREGSPLCVVMASEGRQADGIDLRMSGAQLDRYRANPVLGYGHSYWGRANLPIGRVAPESLKVDGARLLGDLEFDAGDEFAREIERKMRAGFLSAVSIGFEVTKWESAEDNYWRGGVAEQWEMHELSVVPVGMDANALVTAGRGLVDDTDRAWLRQMVAEFGYERVAAVLLGPPPKTPPTPAVDHQPAPPAPGVTEEQGRGLLAEIHIKTEESHA